MKGMIALIITLLFTIVKFGNCLKTCDSRIIHNIISRKECPENLLEKLYSNSPYTYAFNPAGTVPDRVKCAKAVVDKPCDQKAAAHVIVEYKNTSIRDLVQDYRHEEISCGHIKEFDKEGKEYQIYVLNEFPVFCYYRCTTYDTEGDEFAAGAVPLATQSELEVQEGVKKCKNELAAVGVKVPLKDMVTCSK